MTDYTKTGNPPQDGRGISKQIRDEFSLIETAVNSKANIASPTFTGVPAAPTAALGTSTTQLATTAFVAGTSLAATLPAQTGNSGKLITTDGSNASWTSDIKTGVVRFSNSVDATKRLALDTSNISTGTTRVWVVEDNNVMVGTPGMKLVGVATASSSATVDIETTFNSTYDAYLVIATNVIVQTDNVNLLCRLKIGGSYLTTSTYDYTYGNATVGSAYSSTGATSQAEILLSAGAGNASGEHSSFRIWVNNVDSTTLPKTIVFDGFSHEFSLGRPVMINGFGYNSTAGALTGIRIYASSGNISSGTFRVYGFRKAVA